MQVDFPIWIEVGELGELQLDISTDVVSDRPMSTGYTVELNHALLTIGGNSVDLLDRLSKDTIDAIEVEAQELYVHALAQACVYRQIKYRHVDCHV